MATTQTDRGDGPARHPHAGSKHNLLTIPLEMFERIAEFAEPRSLLSIRQVNREAGEKVKRIYVEEHFTKRAFLLWDEDSVGTLMDIAKHPVFGPAMKRVYICADEVAKGGHKWVLEQEARAPELWDRTLGRPVEERIMHLQRMEQWTKLALAQHEFRKRCGDLHLLVMAFSHFRRIGSNVGVSITNQPTTSLTAKGSPTLELLSGQKLMHGMSDCLAVSTVLEALAVAGLPTPEVSIWLDNSDWDVYTLNQCPTTYEYARSVFRRVQRLSVLTDVPAEDTTTQDARHTAELFGSCEEIQRLTLAACTPFDADLDGSSPHDDFIYALLHQTFPTLTSLWLQSFSVPLKHLIAFMKRHKKLEAVALCQTSFHSLEELDEGSTSEEGEHGVRVEKLLLEAAPGIKVTVSGGAEVREWKVEETISG